MIIVKDLRKTFKIYRSPVDRLKEIFTGRKHCREYEALKGVSFEVPPGETLGIIGQNGAGKSTLLKALTGILLPDSGDIHIDGRITGLLELGTGFNPEFTGLQNIHLNGALLGMTKADLQSRLEEITDFAELGDFIQQPLKTYSSGMTMRLAFAIAIHAHPQAFVVDEALSVGDAYFQQKCMQRIRQFKEGGGSIVFVSHDMNAVKVLCDQALLLEEGFVVEQGAPDDVVNAYNFLLARRSKGEPVVLRNETACAAYGNFKVEILNVELLNSQGTDSEVFAAGDHCAIAIHLKAYEDVDAVTVGILIRDKYGQDIFGANTFHLGIPLAMRAQEAIRLEYLIEELNLGAGKYTLTVAAHREGSHEQECYQWTDRIRSFEVAGSKDFPFIGLAKLNPRVRMEPAQSQGS